MTIRLSVYKTHWRRRVQRHILISQLAHVNSRTQLQYLCSVKARCVFRSIACVHWSSKGKADSTTKKNKRKARGQGRSEGHGHLGTREVWWACGFAPSASDSRPPCRPAPRCTGGRRRPCRAAREEGGGLRRAAREEGGICAASRQRRAAGCEASIRRY